MSNLKTHNPPFIQTPFSFINQTIFSCSLDSLCTIIHLSFSKITTINNLPISLIIININPHLQFLLTHKWRKVKEARGLYEPSRNYVQTLILLRYMFPLIRILGLVEDHIAYSCICRNTYLLLVRILAFVKLIYIFIPIPLFYYGMCIYAMFYIFLIWYENIPFSNYNLETIGYANNFFIRKHKL